MNRLEDPQKKNFRFVPLRRKLLANSVLTILFAFVIFGSMVVLNTRQIASQFLSLSEERTVITKETLERSFEESAKKLRAGFIASLEFKGKRLIEKDATSLRPMVEDNSFAAVRDFLRKSFNGDRDLVYASYYVVEEGTIKAWQLLTRKYKEGLELPIEYQSRSRTWVGTLRDGRRVQVFDPDLPDALAASGPRVTLRTIDALSDEGRPSRLQVYDCVIPVTGDDKAESGRSFLRYGLSLEQMERTLAQERQVLDRNLSQLAIGNLRLAEKSTLLVARSFNRSVGLLFVMGLVVIFAAWVLSWIFAKKIVNPIQVLTRVSAGMTAGEYRQDVAVSSDDEVGLLANGFREMAAAILKRDQELAELNRNLERLVELRTQQLNQQLRNVSNLLNNMKQAVFAVSSEWRVTSPVSRFADQVFGAQIDSKSVFDSIYKGLSRESEQESAVRTALSTVFGEGDLQWDLMEELLPRELPYKVSEGNDERTLKVAYSPLWNDSGLLEQILFVVEDITDVLALKQRVEREKEVSARNIQAIQEMAALESKKLRSALAALQSLMSDAAIAAEQVEGAALLRALHTVKGNGRALNFARLAEVTHQQEQRVLNALKSNGGASDELRDSVAKVQGVLAEYSALAQRVFGIPDQYTALNVATIQRRLQDAAFLEEEDREKFRMIFRRIGREELVETTYETSVLIPSFVSLQASLGDLLVFSRSAEAWSSIVLALYRLTQGTEHERMPILQDLQSAAQRWGLAYIQAWVRDELSRGGTGTATRQGMVRQFVQVATSNTLAFFREQDLKEVAVFLAGLSDDPAEASAQLRSQKRMKSFLSAVLIHACDAGVSPRRLLAALEVSIEELVNDKGLDARFYPVALHSTLYAWLLDQERILAGRSLQRSVLEVPIAGVARVRRVCEEIGAHLDPKSAVELQRALIRLDEVPLKQSLHELSGMVQELALRLGKQVRYRVLGDDVTVPRSDLQAFNQVFVQLVRNALDHGVENSEEREEKLKNRESLIEVQCLEAEGELLIVVRDDGRGINREALIRRAIELRLLTESEAVHLDEAAQLELIYQSGLSTSLQATEISGRGIGMDIVRENLAGLKASIEVRSDPVGGTEFRISRRLDLLS